jgi:homoserine kinase
VKRHRQVRVPASSANLGPGYDSMAAALSPGLELEVEETGEFAVRCDVPGVATDRSNLVVRAFEALHPADGLAFDIRSEIPTAAGLGSSAAAIVAGLVAADHMFELDAPLFQHALEIEGHPDNVAAALLGGFVICGEGEPVRFDPPPGLEGVMARPPGELRTAEARAALPEEVPLSDAVHNVANAAMLVLGLARDDMSLVGRGLRDHLHQPRRRALYPASMELLERAVDLGAVGATISGAGPTVLFWCDWQATGALVERLKAEVPDWHVARVSFAPGGADVHAL